MGQPALAVVLVVMVAVLLVVIRGQTPGFMRVEALAGVVGVGVVFTLVVVVAVVVEGVQEILVVLETPEVLVTLEVPPIQLRQTAKQFPLGALTL